MKYLLMVISIMALFNSCKSNSQKIGFEQFKSEISEKTAKIAIDNMPFPYSDNIGSDFTFYPYYKVFGNSGIRVLFNIEKQNEQNFNTKLKQYKLLKNILMTYQDSSNVYLYNDGNNNIEIPEFNRKYENLSSINVDDSKEVDIYLIESGKLQDVFVNQGTSRNYNYSIGIYNFKESSTILYWFLLY